MKKRTAAMFLALTLCLGLGLGAFAASNSETITALLNRDIKIVYNGQAQTFKDAQGNAVYPISYNGSTYLPVRAVSGLVGLPVNFDSASNTVTLGAADKQPTALTGLKNSGGTDYSWVITDKAELTVAGSDANQTFTSGLQWKIWNASASIAAYRMVAFDVAGYTQVSFSAWSDINSVVKVMDQDGNVVTSFDLTAGSIVSKTIDLPAGVTTISFGADGASTRGNGMMKILDPVIQ